jgi:hypothetical protein
VVGIEPVEPHTTGATTDPNQFGERVAGQLEISIVLGAGDLETERVVISHIGTLELSLDNWILLDTNGNEYIFPDLTMYNGGAVALFTKGGNISSAELYWGLDQPIWEVGEVATLFDPAGNPQASYVVP